MEIVERRLTKEYPISKGIELKPVTKNAHLIIKSNLELIDSVFLTFKNAQGEEMKNPINRNGLNRRISIPDWAGIVYLESENIERDISFTINLSSS